MNDTTKAPLLDLNSMVGESLDAIPDAPDFSNPPAGEYKIEVKDALIDTYTDKKTQAKAQRLKILYAVAETIAVADPKEAPVPDGTMFSETFQGTEQGVGYFKARVKGIMDASDLNGVTLGDMMMSIKGTVFGAKISIKKTPKNDGTGELYENLQIRVTKAPAVTE